MTNSTNNENLLKNTDIQKIAEEGATIYGKIKVKYDPKEKGKFLAIDIESKKAYLGNTSAEALELARSEPPHLDRRAFNPAARKTRTLRGAQGISHKVWG